MLHCVYLKNSTIKIYHIAADDEGMQMAAEDQNPYNGKYKKRPGL